MTDKAQADPLTETSYLILLSLANTPKHGYAIMQEVAELSDNRVELSTGTLYGALNRMLDSEWIEREQDAADNSRGKKIYRLTKKGQATLADEIHRMKQMIALANARQLGG